MAEKASFVNVNEYLLPLGIAFIYNIQLRCHGCFPQLCKRVAHLRKCFFFSFFEVLGLSVPYKCFSKRQLYGQTLDITSKPESLKDPFVKCFLFHRNIFWEA